MKKILFFLFLLFLGLSKQDAIAQNHVSWEARFDAKNSEIVVYAKIDATWHLYSVNNPPDSGPVPTTFIFPKLKRFKTKGNVQEQKPVVAFDSNFGATVSYHEHAAEFRQKVKIKKHKKIEFTVSYMVCDDAQCLPPTDVVLVVTIL